MTVKESVIIDLEQMQAVTLNGVEIKYARKVVQDHLKRFTNMKGYWTVWFDGDDGELYHFKLHHPYSFMVKSLQN